MKQKSIRDVCKRVTDSDVTHICSVSSIQQYKGVKIPPVSGSGASVTDSGILSMSATDSGIVSVGETVVTFIGVLQHPFGARCTVG